MCDTGLEARQAFVALTTAMVIGPVLQTPDLQRPSMIFTEAAACNIVTGVTLAQKHAADWKLVADW